MINYFKTIIVSCYLIFYSSIIFSQANINKIEYYIDVDPGYGNGTPVNITQSANLSELKMSFDPSALSSGAHLIGVRAKDANGFWSFDNKWVFVKVALQNSLTSITAAEYYVDKDPGYNKAIPISISPATNISDKVQNIRLDTLSAGVHLIGIRAKDAIGSWSLDNKWLFVKQIPLSAVPNIVKVEYFIDTTPGMEKQNHTLLNHLLI